MSKDMGLQDGDDMGVRIGDSPDGKDSRPLNMEELLFKAKTEGTWIVFSPLGDVWTSVTTVDGLGIFYEALCGLIKESIERRLYREGSGLAKVIDPAQVEELTLEVVIRMLRNMASGVDPLSTTPKTN